MEQSQRDLRPGWIKARDEGRELTWQQRLAERTNGVVRLPNLMTATGVGLTMLSAYYASHDRPMAAMVSGTVGFALDSEGSVGQYFDVLDPVHGPKIDQIADITKAVIIGSTLIAHDILPRSAAALTYGPKLVGASAGMVAKITSGTELPSSKIGKVAEVCRDVVSPAFLMAAAGDVQGNTRLKKAGTTIGWSAVGAAVTMGTVAAIGYTREAIAAKKSADLSVRPAEIPDRAES